MVFEQNFFDKNVIFVQEQGDVLGANTRDRHVFENNRTRIFNKSFAVFFCLHFVFNYVKLIFQNPRKIGKRCVTEKYHCSLSCQKIQKTEFTFNTNKQEVNCEA